MWALRDAMLKSGLQKSRPLAVHFTAHLVLSKCKTTSHIEHQFIEQNQDRLLPKGLLPGYRVPVPHPACRSHLPAHNPPGHQPRGHSVPMVY